MARKPKITFSKMDQDPSEGTGHITIYVGGERRGWIDKESTYEDIGLTTSVFKYTADSYEAVVWRRYEEDDRTAETIDGVFQVSDYDGPRAALAAAKQWTRDILS